MLLKRPVNKNNNSFKRIETERQHKIEIWFVAYADV